MRWRHTMGAAVAMLALLGGAGRVRAQYNPAAGRSAPMEAQEQVVRDEEGRVVARRKVLVKAAPDRYGNAAGNRYDLAVDGAFKGQTIAVLHFYTGEGFDFELPRAALKQKGFSVYRWLNGPPTATALRQALRRACQLWIISGERQLLGPDHLAVIKEFFASGKGVYIWGDNEPYYADANYVAKALLGVTMQGNLPGDRVVRIQATGGGHRVGLLPNHLLTTGLAFLYEGITIATIQANQTLTPLLFGSAGNLVASFYDQGGKRAILDGGFTRLYRQWNTAGTGRYIKNAAAWLVNVERRGKVVTAAGGSPAKTPAQPM